jgi:hypothetical protein
MESVGATAGSETIVRLDVSRAFHADPGALCRALVDPVWLGDVVDPPPGRPDLIRVQTDMAFTLQADRREVVFRKAALLDIGMGPARDCGCAGEIAWRAASFAPLFPLFAGRLTVTRSRLQLEGVYAPPGGQLGLLIDRAMIHRVADRTARWFLDKLVTELREMELRKAT